MHWCREHMARFKVPRTVVFGPLPKTSTGKIQKFVLREQAGTNARPARSAAPPGTVASFHVLRPPGLRILRT